MINKISSISRGKSSSVIVLTMHHIESSEEFEKLIKFLAKYFEFIDPYTFTLYIECKYDFIGCRILLTYDDAFLSSYLKTRKTMSKYNIKALYFIPVGFIGLSMRRQQIGYMVEKLKMPVTKITKSMRPMSWSDIILLVKEGHTIGSHSITHGQLNLILDNKALEYELESSKDIIEKRIGRIVTDFAFPFGHINSLNMDLIAIAKKYYNYLYLTLHHYNDNKTFSEFPSLVFRCAADFDYMSVKYILLNMVRKKNECDYLGNI